MQEKLEKKATSRSIEFLEFPTYWHGTYVRYIDTQMSFKHEHFDILPKNILRCYLQKWDMGPFTFPVRNTFTFCCIIGLVMEVRN